MPRIIICIFIIFAIVIMTHMIYLTVVLLVSFFSLAIGFRRGIIFQLGSVLGLAFGAVTSRVLTPEWASHFLWTAPFGVSEEFADFTANLVCGCVIYFIVYSVFALLVTPVLRSALSVFETGIFNRILGAFFNLLKNLLWLSIIFNLMLCGSSGSGLLRYEQANDGNLVAAVMWLTPALLGCYGAEDFAHFHQLRHAKTISCNFNESPNVIIINHPSVSNS